MENPSHMTPLSQCWKLDRPSPDEATGRKRAELFKTQLHKFDTIVKEYKVHITNLTAHHCGVNTLVAHCLQHVKEKPKVLSVAEMMKTQQNTMGMSIATSEF